MKNKNQKIAITIVLLVLCFGVFAQRPGGQGRRSNGQGGKPDASQILSKLDTNNDSKIDVDEASKDQRGKISQDFDTIDTNDDQYIDLSELEASLNNKGPKNKSAEIIIKETDDNGDGKLNALEVAAKEQLMLTNNFDEIDTNNDNEIDLEELQAFIAKSDDKKSKKRKNKKQ